MTIMRTVTLLAFLALAPAVGATQVTTSVLQGAVRDATGAVLPGATITATDLATGTETTVQSDASGTYLFARVRPGIYRIEIQLAGFRPQVRPEVAVLVATPVTMDVVLDVGELTQEVSVVGSSLPRINRVDATTGQTFTTAQIEALPFAARNPTNLLTLQPGVLFTGNSDPDQLLFGSAPRGLETQDGVVNGAPANQVNITIDGADANDWETQAAFASALPLTLDSIQEFRVTTSTGTASAGVAGGAQVALVTRSGSNQFRGNARWQYRDDAWAANAFFNNATTPAVPKPTLERSVFGGSLGGPIRRNRAFLFFDVEGRRDSSETPQLRIVPSETLKQGAVTYRTTAGALATLTPAQVRTLDPLGLGVNPTMLQYLRQFPSSNDPSAGPDGGLNFGGFRFNAPVETRNEIYTLRTDLNLGSRGQHRFAARVIAVDLQTDVEPPQFPDLSASSQLVNRSWGTVVSYDSQVGPRLLQTMRYGLTVQDVETTGVRGAFFRTTPLAPFLDGGTPLAVSRASGRQVFVHQFDDDLTYARGRHTWRAGGSLRIVRNDRFADTNAFPTYEVGTFFCARNCRDPFDTLIADADPGNDPSDLANFSSAITALLGPVTRATATALIDPATGQVLPFGTSQTRRFAENGIELYLQDTWRVSNDFTVNAGLRYSYYTPIWETNGAMVRTTESLNGWWNDRLANMARGVPADASPRLAWEPAGRANDAPGWYRPDRNNLAPRVSAVWSPSFENGFWRSVFGAPGASALRAGFGVYYHRIGGSLAATTDRIGSPGTATGLASGQGSLSLVSSPRLSGTCDASGCSGLPDLSAFFTVPASGAFPATVPSNFTSFGFAVDDAITTPYSLNSSVSFQRDVGRGIVLDVGYVGTRGKDLLLKKDYAQFGGLLKDPVSGQTLWDAQTLAAQLIGPDFTRPGISPANPSGVPSIPFVENLMPNLPGYLAQRLNNQAFASMTPSQAFYVFMVQNAPNWARSLATLDVNTGGSSPWNTAIDPERNGFVLFAPQFQWMPTWTGGGRSEFDSLQLTVRRQARSATFALNYVFAVARDLVSAAENASGGSPLVGGSFGNEGQLVNSLQPELHWAHSDYDVRHNLNAHWAVELPLTRRTSGVVHAFAGGWSLAGIWRWRSGLPVVVANGAPRSTNFILSGPATVTGDLDTDVTMTGPNGRPNLFADPVAARSRLSQTAPGGAGSRNVLRGPSYSTVDVSLNKAVPLPWARHRLDARISAFNAFNRPNFWVSGSNNMGYFATAQNYGTITATAGPRGGAREVEFALRYTF